MEKILVEKNSSVISDSDLTHIQILKHYTSLIEKTETYELYRKASFYFFIFKDKLSKNTKCWYLNKDREIAVLELFYIVSDVLLISSVDASQNEIAVPEFKASNSIEISNQIYALLDKEYFTKEWYSLLGNDPHFKNAPFYSEKNNSLVFLTEPNKKNDIDLFLFNKNEFAQFFYYPNCYLKSHIEDFQNLVVCFDPYFVYNNKMYLDSLYIIPSKEYDIYFVDNLCKEFIELKVDNSKFIFSCAQDIEQTKKIFDLAVRIANNYSVKAINLEFHLNNWILSICNNKTEDITELYAFVALLQKKLRALCNGAFEFNQDDFKLNNFTSVTFNAERKKIFSISATYKNESMKLIIEQLFLFSNVPFQIEVI